MNSFMITTVPGNFPFSFVSGKRPFSCNICGFATSRAVYLKHHVDTMHVRKFSGSGIRNVSSFLIVTVFIPL